MEKIYWLWYPGDFELYHAMKQNFSRVERGYGWPAFWKSEGFRNRVAFRRSYLLEKETMFCVYSGSVGFVLAEDRKYPFGEWIVCGPGQVSISIHTGCIESFPSIYIKGEVIRSDEGWMAEDYENPPVAAGHNRYYTEARQNPAHWEYSEKIYEPVKKEKQSGGVLFEFETELTATLEVKCKKDIGEITVYCGESKPEALDMVHCYYSWKPDKITGRCPRCAVRFAFIPECMEEEISLTAHHQYVDIPVRANFHCDNELINKIWSVAEHTFRLCSGIFFIDGIKRDKWIWSGDAYQSFFVNQYLLADPDIDQRTLLALRGNDPINTHINTILDYSFFWILGVKAHYEAYGDLEFVRQTYPKMCSLMKFCEQQTDEHGFIYGREKDWVYIDWADIDKEGVLCAEQMLYAASWKVMEDIGKQLGKNVKLYKKKYEVLVENIQKFFWDEEKGAYIDSFSSGRHHVTRHANIFAILFEIADKEKEKKIVKKVIMNDDIPAITTPYFQFFELDVLCLTGQLETVFQKIQKYWGGMLKRGAVTFWEEYDPKTPEAEQYDMYGDKFGKSLCHAWSASPIYLLSKYFVGLQVGEAGKNKFCLRPQLEYFKTLDCTLPVGTGSVHVVWNERTLTVEVDSAEGKLQVHNEQIMLVQGQTVRISI